MENLRELAYKRINEACDQFKVLNAAFSAGKDSTSVLLMIIMVLLDRKAKGLSVPVLYVTTSSTKIESIPIQQNIEYQHDKIREYCESVGLVCYIDMPSPQTGSDFIGVLSGKGMMPSPNMNRHSCTMDWKINSQKLARNRFMKAHGYRFNDVLILIGSRSDESTNREKNVAKKGHATGKVVFDAKAKEFSMAPIVDWASDDVWELIAEARNNMVPTWDSLEKTIEIYRAAAGGECPIVAGDTVAQAGGCGSSRTGCAFCTAVNPHTSSDARIAETEEYAFTKPLHHIQMWLSTVISNYDYRSWISRSLWDENGRQLHPSNLPGYEGKCYVKIAPHYYSSDLLIPLFRYVLTAQINENEWADRNKTEPRFTFITLEEIMYIDLKWTERGIAKPYTALHELHEIMNEGKRYYPDVENLPPVTYQKMPKSRYLEVENVLRSESFKYSGLSDINGEITGAYSHTEMGYEDNGKVFYNRNSIVIPSSLNLDDTLTFNPEALWYIGDNLEEYSQRHLKSEMGSMDNLYHFSRLGAYSLSAVMANNLDFRLKMNTYLSSKGFLTMNGLELFEQGVEIHFKEKTQTDALSDIPVVTAQAPSHQPDLFAMAS